MCIIKFLKNPPLKSMVDVQIRLAQTEVRTINAKEKVYA